MPTRRRPDAGFLLPETLATFTLSAFVLLGLASSASVILRAIDRSAAHVQEIDDLGRTMAALRRDVSTLRRARWAGFEPQPFVFKGGPNSLYFARSERDAKASEQTKVVALREVVVGNATRLVRADAPYSPRATSFDDLEFGPQRVLPTGPARLRFYYVSERVQGQVAETLANNWPSGRTLPGAIIIEAVEADSTRRIVSERIPIRADADIGCIDAGGANGQGQAGGPNPSANAGQVAPPAPPQQNSGDASLQTDPANAQQAGQSGAPGAASANAGFCGRSDNGGQQASGAPGLPGTLAEGVPGAPGQPAPGGLGPNP